MAGRPIPSSVPSTMMPATVDYVKTNPQVLNHNKHQILDMFNVATTFCKRVTVKELVTSAPVYTTITANFMELLFFICGLYGPSSGLSLMLRRWASKNTAGSTKNGRDSKPKNLR
ncbi:hypothetical protein Goari_012446, partial [Gossypium aridum]|nr:hypothetical protein [Gossypium aridum]